MGELVLKDAYVRIGATGSSGSLTNMTDHVRSVTLTWRSEIQDKTAMTDDARSRINGLKDAECSLEMNQDYGSTNYDKTFWNMVGSTDAWIVVRPTTAVQAGTNPSYKGHFLLPEYTPVAGSVGDLATFSVSFQGNGVVTRTDTAT